MLFKIRWREHGETSWRSESIHPINGRYSYEWMGKHALKGIFYNPCILSVHFTIMISNRIKMSIYILIRILILDLKPASRYEATIAAQNAEDWSRHSRIYHFSTFGAGMINV